MERRALEPSPRQRRPPGWRHRSHAAPHQRERGSRDRGMKMRKNVRNLLLQALAGVLLAGGALGAVNAGGDEANASAQPRGGAYGTPGAPGGFRGVWPVLKTGSRGTDVRTVQYLLAARGHAVKADGAYGRNTAAAVAKFQKRAGLKADGTVGPKTWVKLTALTLRTGSRGPAVRAVQVQLGIHPDGIYGPNTTTAVAKFQTRKNLAGTGTVDTRTWGRPGHRLLRQARPPRLLPALQEELEAPQLLQALPRPRRQDPQVLARRLRQEQGRVRLGRRLAAQRHLPGPGALHQPRRRRHRRLRHPAPQQALPPEGRHQAEARHADRPVHPQRDDPLRHPGQGQPGSRRRRTAGRTPTTTSPSAASSSPPPTSRTSSSASTRPAGPTT
ncbi:peptidoglycan-binding domain-containing protein [Streptomyces filamentosus]|uniref:peptidoglycan-binding domain-containing protein n=1 Tax=Streptomyces filamentosus TaxID=67294 RepID=UPI0027E413B1|nr:peptidoglycan-binding protein [Streptomyces filamentosus]